MSAPASVSAWELVTRAFEDRGLIVRRRGADGWDARCPVGAEHSHEDRRPSVTGDYRDGKVLLRCHAYPELHTGVVLAEAVGLTAAALFDQPAERARSDHARPRHLRAVGDRKCGHTGQPRVIRHVYPDADGEVKGVIVRTECAVCGKRISTSSERKWPVSERILYRLPEVLAAVRDGRTVIVVEGEKSADMVAGLGQVATCNPFGADEGKGSKWLPQMTEALRGAVLVVIIADHDAKGYRHALYVAGQLRAAGIPVRVTRSATGQPKDDVVEHFQAGYELEDLVDADPEAMLAELAGKPSDAGSVEVLEELLEEISPEPVIPEAFLKRRVMNLPSGERYPVDQRLLPDSMSLDAARWFDPGEPGFTIDQVLPHGAIAVWGPPGVGKTRLSVQWEHAKAYGVKWAGHKPAAGRVLVIDYENGAPAAMNTSVDYAALGQLPIDKQWSAPPELGDLIPSDQTLITVETRWPGETFAERFDQLEKRLREADAAGCPYRLVRIDTLRAFISPYPSTGNDYRWEAQCLLPLNNLAKRLEMSIVVIHHSNKAGQISGSTGIEASLEGSYKISLNEDTGIGMLHCSKIRGAPKRHYEMRWKDGFWIVSGEIPESRVLATGTAAAILELLDRNGTARLEEIKAALPKTSLGVIKTTLWRMKEKGWVDDKERGTWVIIRRMTPIAPPADRCPVCHNMLDPVLIAAGITMHPTCEFPDGGDESPARPPTPKPQGWDPGTIGEEENRVGDAGDGEDQDAGDQPASAAEACSVCGELITDTDQHPDCARQLETSQAREDRPHWQGMTAMQKCFARGQSRMHPVPLIRKPDDPKVKEGMPTRDLPQWQAAAEAADITALWFSWIRPGLLEEFGPDALILSVDRNGSFPSALNSLPVAPNVLLPYGPMDADPRTLGKPDPHKNGRPTGLAGIAVVTVSEWDDTVMPHPLGRHARPGQQLPVPTNMLEKLWDLHKQGRMPQPEVTQAFLGRRSTTLFEPFAAEVKAARTEYAGEPEMLAAVKLSSSIAIRKFRPVFKPSPWFRPDWYAANVVESAIRTWAVADRAAQKGVIVAGIGRTDETSFVIPAGADPQEWTPAGYTFGRDFGQVKPKPVRIRSDRVDMSGIDPAQITSPDRKGYVDISGPMPLAVWLARHA